MDKTFAAIEKLKEVELELHRLKNYAEMMNRSVEAKRKWQGLTDEERNDCLVEADPCEALLNHEAWELMRTVEAKLKEKNT